MMIYCKNGVVAFHNTMITNKINFLQARRAKINIQLLELQQKHNDLLEEKKKIAMDILDAGVLENLNILNAKIEELSKEQGEIEQSLKIWKENECRKGEGSQYCVWL